MLKKIANSYLKQYIQRNSVKCRKKQKTVNNNYWNVKKEKKKSKLKRKRMTHERHAHVKKNLTSRTTHAIYIFCFSLQNQWIGISDVKCHTNRSGSLVSWYFFLRLLFFFILRLQLNKKYKQICNWMRRWIRKKIYCDTTECIKM